MKTKIHTTITSKLELLDKKIILDIKKLLIKIEETKNILDILNLYYPLQKLETQKEDRQELYLIKLGLYDLIFLINDKKEFLILDVII